MSKCRWLIVFTAILCSQGFYAQSTQRYPLSIEEMFRLADENSQSIRAHQTGVEATAEALKNAKAQRLPDIQASLSVSYLGDGRVWDRDFRHGTPIDIPHFGNNFALEASQVIYAGGAISSGIELAELAHKMSLLDGERNKQEIRFLLVGHYLDLYKLGNQLQVLQKNLELTEQLIQHMKARNDEGTVLKNDITRYELQREMLALQITRVQHATHIINHQLTTTLHLPDNALVVPDTTFLNRQTEMLSETAWQQLAATNNLRLKQSEIAAQMEQQKVKLERSELMPKVALVAADHLNGPVTIEVPALDNNFNYWYVGIGMKYNLSSLFKNNKKLKQSKLNARRATEELALAQEQTTHAVQSSFTNLQTALADLHTQEKSMELANEHYRITRNRYENELALLTELLDASNMKLNAELDWVNSRANVIYNGYKMKYVTHTIQ